MKSKTVRRLAFIAVILTGIWAMNQGEVLGSIAIVVGLLYALADSKP